MDDEGEEVKEERGDPEVDGIWTREGVRETGGIN